MLPPPVLAAAVFTRMLLCAKEIDCMSLMSWGLLDVVESAMPGTETVTVVSVIVHTGQATLNTTLFVGA